MTLKMKIFVGVAIFLLGVLFASSVIYFAQNKNKSAVQQTNNLTSNNEKQLYSCGMHPDVISEEPGNCPICGMKLTPIKNQKSSVDSEHKSKKKILYWRAPMDPTFISDNPGKSPMGMNLVPVYEGEEASGTGSILIDPVTVQNMGIKTSTVMRKDIHKTIRAVGTIVYNEEKLYTINGKISGWIEKLYVNVTGQFVKKGEPLLEIYSPELVSAQEEYLLALKNKELAEESSFDEIKKGARSLLVSTRKRLENWDISPALIDALEKRGTVTKTMTLTSPANGVVVFKNAVEGAYFKEGANLYQIANISSVWVEASIYENELPWVETGQLAVMELSYLPGKTYRGKVAYIYPYLEQKSRTAKVRIEFLNPELELKPDMFANVLIQTASDRNVLVIPDESVIRSGKRNLVFVVREQGKFEPREITIGAESDDGDVKIISGLLEGEQVVVSGQFLLDSESNAQEAIKKMLESKQKTAVTSVGHGNKEKRSDGKMEQMKQPAPGNKSNIEKTKHQHSDQAEDHVSSALYTCPMHPEFTTDDPNQKCPLCEMKLNKKKDLAEGTKLYTCPMHPEFVTDDLNGKCSLCEMNLVEKNSR